MAQVDHLPIAAAFCHRIDLIKTVDRLVPTEMALGVGTIVQAMVLDTLSGRSPLYRLAEFFESRDAALLLGRDVPAEAFNDTTVARAMDAIFKAGAQAVFSGVAFQAAQAFPLDLTHVHFDTTSVNVWGDYAACGRGAELLDITYGKSKDHRPDLKQFVVQMLCVNGNVPILGGCADGNASDKTLNKVLLARISEHMRKHGIGEGGFLYVADCAVVTEGNLDLIGGNRFVTRLPFSYAEAGRVVAEAVTENVWELVGELSETPGTAARPAAVYRVAEKTVTLYRQEYRALVVHSSAHDHRRTKRLDRDIESSEQAARDALAPEARRKYLCRADAEAAAETLRRGGTDLHRIEAVVEELVTYAPGRPPKDRPRKISARRYVIRGEIIAKPEPIERRRAEAGCFVLISNVPREGAQAMTATELQRAYKDQFGIERNFSFLKDPLIVNDIFLKKPERIEALGAILLIALLVSNLIEFVLRQHVKPPQTTLPGWDGKQTKKPTAFMMRTKFAGIIVVRAGNLRSFGRPLNPVQTRYLDALGVSPHEFLWPFGGSA